MFVYVQHLDIDIDTTRRPVITPTNVTLLNERFLVLI